MSFYAFWLTTPDVYKRQALGRVKTNIDSGIFNAIQWAGVEALNRVDEVLKNIIPVYTERRNLVVETFSSLGFDITPPQASFYLWVPVPCLLYTSFTYPKFLLSSS